MHTSRTRLGRLLGAVALLGAAFVGAGASSAGATPSPLLAKPAPCTPASSGSVASDAAGPGAAALLQATVTVGSTTTAHPRCYVLRLGEKLRLRIGDRAEFVANGRPGLRPAHTGVVKITTRRGPTETGPGHIATKHVIAIATGVKPGKVTLTWIDCSGTGC